MAQPKPVRILMVDDVTRYHSLYEMAINDAFPAKVSFATNGEEALEKLEKPMPFDLLILDLNMPKLGGEETLRRIRCDHNFDNMPVIILTGYTDQETHKRLLDMGADDFIEKGAPPEIFSARLKAQLRHKLSLDQLTRVAVDMDIFAAGVLHDIRNLETNILTICELARTYLEDDPRGQQQQILEDFQSLEEKAHHLGHYATEIIEMVRDTRTQFKPGPQHLSELIEWVIRVAQPQAKEPSKGTAPKLLKGTTESSLPQTGLTWSAATTLEPVVADRHFLQLALLNIVQNSVKYARHGVDPVITVSQEPAHDLTSKIQGSSLITRFRDNGTGIKEGELRKVFEPFVRGSDQGKKDGGFGLGLSLVVKVITTMGGRVWAERPQDQEPGTVICIELPAATKSDRTRHG